MPSVNQSIYQSQSDQGASSFNKLYATGSSLIIVLLTLVQVRYGNKEASPFETHRLVNKLYATGSSLIIVLLTLVQVRYGNKEASPFETHRLVMMLFIVTMVINALVAVAAITLEAWFTNHSLVPVLKQMFIAFGVLACGLLLLILAPPVGYFFLVISALLALFYYVLKTVALYQPLMALSPQASGAPPMSPTSAGHQDGDGETSIEINTELTAPQA